MKYLPSILAVLGAALTAFSDPLQQIIVAHPALASILGALAVIFAHVAPQPQK